MEVNPVGTALGNVVMGIAMSFYGINYLADKLRQHDGNAPKHFMIIQFALVWGMLSSLAFFVGHTGFNAAWIGAMNSAGATVIGIIMCRHKMKKEKERQMD